MLNIFGQPIAIHIEKCIFTLPLYFYHMKKTSLEDVAKALGVSKTLVSMVINGKAAHYGISKITEERVWAKIQEMGFKPNQTARKLRTGKSNVIGLIVADISNPFYAKIARSIEDAASAKGYHLVICSSDEKPQREADLVSVLCDQHQVDGLIVSSTLDNPALYKRLEQQKLPFLLMDREFPKFNFPSVTVDNEQGAAMVVEHLLGLGMRRIGMITLSPAHLSTLKDRFTGYKEALQKQDVAFNPELLREVTFENMQEEMRTEVAALLSPSIKAEAIFTANNTVALHALEALREMNVRIPEDVALVSFDDIEVFKFTQPPVTAIRQPLEEIGKSAVALLFRLMEGEVPEAEQHVVLPVQLVVRESCGQASRKMAVKR